VAGMYRTGKSYLLNRMLLNRSDGFGVGPSINPCTKVRKIQTLSENEHKILTIYYIRVFGFGENLYQALHQKENQLMFS
jgi:hypothetical protein